VGEGWLIFGLPPAEVAVHPSGKNDVHEFYLMCDDIEGFVADIVKRKIRCDPIQDLGWGRLTRVVLPGGGRLGVYEPRHARPPAFRAGKTATKPAKLSPGRSSKRTSGKTSRTKGRRA
jgi:hypothetical protein